MKTETEIRYEVQCQTGYEEYLQTFADSPIIRPPEPYEIYQRAFLDGLEFAMIEMKPKLKSKAK
jgi:hypothetical protein